MIIREKNRKRSRKRLQSKKKKSSCQGFFPPDPGTWQTIYSLHNLMTGRPHDKQPYEFYIDLTSKRTIVIERDAATPVGTWFSAFRATRPRTVVENTTGRITDAEFA
jgi:hypothetical protein